MLNLSSLLVWREIFASYLCADLFLIMKKNPYMLFTFRSCCELPHRGEERHFALLPSTSHLSSREVRERSSRFILTSYPSLTGTRSFSRYYHHVDIFFISMETSSRAALRGERRRKKREAGRAEKKRLWHSFPCRHYVTYWTYRFTVRRFWQGATTRLISKTELNPSAIASSLIEFKARVRKLAGCGRGADTFRSFVITAMFFHALFFSLSLLLCVCLYFSFSFSLFIFVPNHTYNVSSVFLLRLFFSLTLSHLLIVASPLPPSYHSLSPSVYLSLRYLLHHFLQLSFSRSFHIISPLVNCHSDNYCSFSRSPLRFPSYLLLPFPSSFFRYILLSFALC